MAFSDRADTTSALEFRDEGQMVLLSRRNWGRNKRQSGNDHFEICPQLKSATFTKMVKMPDCCMCSQQFTIKRGVTRLSVSQLSGVVANGPQISAA
jgi:hypothetical protein